MSTEHQSKRWVERQWAARFVRVAVYAVPLGLSILASLTLTSLLATPTSITWSVLRWILVVAVSTAVLVGTERISRRMLPLATLLKLSLAFPDKVPSRFAIALRIGTTSQLRERIEAAQRGEIADTPGAAAEQLLELVGLLSHHDRLTRGHSERVRAYTHLVGVEMGITGDELERLRWSALLHDVGKIMIPGAILNKPGRLTDEEFDTIKTHPAEGKQLVEPLADWLGESVRAVWEHHERYDGRGYPSGLAGNEISLAARIVSVTDAFDVMTSARSYKKPMSAAAARTELSDCAGTQFDPAVVRAFVAASIGTTQTATKPLAFLAQFLLLPRTFVANATATLGTTAALAAGTVVGTVGHSAAAERPMTIPYEVSADGAELAALTRHSSGSGSDGESLTGGASGNAQPDGVGPSDVVVSTSTSVEPPASVPPTGTVPDWTDPDGTLPQPDVTPPDWSAPPTFPTTSLGPGSTNPSDPLVVIPPIVLPEVTVPEIGVPTVTVPVVTVPTVNLPTVTVPVVTVPVITVPSLSVPLVPITVPEVVVSVPPISVPPISVPPISVPPISLPPISVPPVSVPPISVPPVTLPRIGLFGL